MYDLGSTNTPGSVVIVMNSLGLTFRNVIIEKYPSFTFPANLKFKKLALLFCNNSFIFVVANSVRTILFLFLTREPKLPSWFMRLLLQQIRASCRRLSQGRQLL